ncbi:MAG: hypothetical protein JRH20_25065 [Deltaproteobacteria bacterium]|nr:hypothetical protein [Deltaproteobacteria bacterium]
MKRYLAVAILSLSSLLPLTATAKAEKMLPYSYQAVWSTMIRLIRVDRGYPISDKDKDNGYVLFVFPGSGSVKKCPAALELFQTKDPTGRDMIRVKLRIAHQPSYIELHFLDALERKLRQERGTPHPPKEPKPTPEPPTKDN